MLSFSSKNERDFWFFVIPYLVLNLFQYGAESIFSASGFLPEFILSQVEGQE